MAEQTILNAMMEFMPSYDDKFVSLDDQIEGINKAISSNTSIHYGHQVLPVCDQSKSHDACVICDENKVCQFKLDNVFMKCEAGNYNDDGSWKTSCSRINAIDYSIQPLTEDDSSMSVPNYDSLFDFSKPHQSHGFAGGMHLTREDLENKLSNK